MNRYTVICQHVTNPTQVWTGTIKAEDIDHAIDKGQSACLHDWGHYATLADIHVLAVFEGEMDPSFWETLEDA